jgi:hypothetical protein
MPAFNRPDIPGQPAQMAIPLPMEFFRKTVGRCKKSVPQGRKSYGTF